jgi:Protein of unknown function (DUF2911)
MKTLKSPLFVLATILAGMMPLMAQQARVNSTGGNSPHETTGGVIGGRGGDRVTITYGRPFAKDRKIWGTKEEKALVPYGDAWRLGSDEATTLITQKPIVFGETEIPAGVYTLYMVPMQDGASKLAFSSALGGWGIPVDQKHDVTRIDLKKDALDSKVEQLTIAVANDAAAGGGVIKISWENTQYSAAFTVKK